MTTDEGSGSVERGSATRRTAPDDPLERVRRAKARRTTDRWLDGGAVAAGVVAALGPQVVPSFLFAAGIPDRVVRAAAAVTLVCALFGGYAAGWLAGPGGRRGARHGAAALAASVVGAAGAGVLLLGSAVLAVPALALPLVDAPLAVGHLIAPAVAVAGLAGAVTGSVGGRRKAAGD